jgi:hypothetical protein
VLLLIGYWLAKRRDTFYVRGERLEPVVATRTPVPQIVDTERGRMQ